MKPHQLDEFPVHQTPLSMAQAGSSDRNFYDRCYFNAHDRTGERVPDHRARRVPEPGRAGRLRHRPGPATRSSRCASPTRWDDRCTHAVGATASRCSSRCIVPTGLRQPDRGFDLTWEGSFHAVLESSTT